MAVLPNIKKVVSRPLGALGLVLVAALLLSALFADVLAPYNYSKISIKDRFQTPSLHHLLGTDHLGRDLMSRALIGGQVAMKVVVICIGLSMVFGVILGIIAGMAGRVVETAITLLFDVVRSFPTIMLALALVIVFGPSLQTVILVVVVGYTTVYGRVARTLTMSIRHSEFVLAAQTMGASPARIILRHIMPNIIGSLIILASMDVPLVITIEAGLSFMGLGIRPPVPSWGNILNDGYVQINNTIWPLLAGGLPIVLATLGFTFLGETLRDVFDPKLEQKKVA
jgi:peptide/nickel transport system permease protein